MPKTDYKQLEKNKVFKRSYFKNTLWWKNIVFLPPTLLIFVGLVGIIFLLERHMLATWYIAPYLIFFTLGTIWLKAAKLHVVKSELKRTDAYLVCLAQPIAVVEGHSYVIFTTSNRRTDTSYLKYFAGLLDADRLVAENKNKAKKKSILLHHDESDTDFYLRAFFNATIKKRNSFWEEEAQIPVLYVSDKKTFIIKGKDLIEE